ncbi:MAG: helix-turn-helix domain-containing protein [Firmicutes bacterium]|nr:helix-turn-helix domain-containing protein [Bacillota bacterium]
MIQQRLTITVEEAGNLMGVSRATAYKIAGDRQANGFPCYTVGRAIRVKYEQFLKWFEELEAI